MDATSRPLKRGDPTLYGFAAAGAVVVLLSVAAYWLGEQQVRAGSWVVRTHEVLAAIERLRADAAEDRHGPAPRRDLEALRELVADNPAQLAIAAGIERALAAGEGSGSLREAMARLEAGERQLLTERLAAHHQRVLWAWSAIGLLVAATLAVLAMLYAMVRRRREAQDRRFEAEQRFHVMTREVQDYAILMLDRDGKVLSWNAGVERIHGYGEEEIVGRDFSCFYDPEDVAAGKPQHVLAVAAAEGHYHEEAWRVGKEGRHFWASVSVTALHDAEGALWGFAKVTRDLTERRRAEEAARLKELSTRLINAQEEERRRIARELHDETGQALTAIRLRLVEMLRARDAAPRQVEECLSVLDNAVAQIRGMSQRLRPPMLDDLGLVDALEWMLEQQSRAAGWRSTFEAQPTEDRLPPEIETACFRIAQEALTNAARHARAGAVVITLRRDDRGVVLTVADDGDGFDPARYATPEERRLHFGLLSMAERASLAGGHLEIDSLPGEGTRITVTFPLRALEPEFTPQAAGRALPA